MNSDLLTEIQKTLISFIDWLESFGETSYDHQSYYAGPIGGFAKRLYYQKPYIGTLAVAPMVFSESFFPTGRKLFWKRQRLPIADAHYSMGFSFLSKKLNDDNFYKKAIHFLEVLEQTRCHGYNYHGWGYPFHWETRNGRIPKGTPLITTTPYVYEAFLKTYQIDGNKRWLKILKSIADHVYYDYDDFKYSEKSSASAYTPDDEEAGVINASAYRAFVLTSAAQLFSEKKYSIKAERNLNFVLETQQNNGSWYYHAMDERDFVDHFHTCFVLKALAKIEQLTGHERCHLAIKKGVAYYVNNLFDQQRLPKPFSRNPRLTVYKNELYDYAECINLAVLLNGWFENLDNILINVLEDVLQRWKKSDGSFHSRKLFFGWDNVPMHRWAQSQMFRALAFVLHTFMPY
jgi:hypothetical protein